MTEQAKPRGNPDRTDLDTLREILSGLTIDTIESIDDKHGFDIVFTNGRKLCLIAFERGSASLGDLGWGFLKPHLREFEHGRDWLRERREYELWCEENPEEGEDEEP